MKLGTFACLVALGLMNSRLLAQSRPWLEIKLDHLAAKAVETVDVSLNADTLRMAGAFFSGDASKESGLKKVLDGLKAITVRSYTFAQDGQYQPQELDPVRAQLTSPQWSRIVSERSAKESTEIFLRTEQGKIAGLAVLAAEPRELTVVYVDGNIDLASLAAMQGTLGIPAGILPDSNSNSKGKKGK